MIPQNIPEKLLNRTSIRNNFKSFIKQVYQKHRTPHLNNKNDQNSYSRVEIRQKDEQLLGLK